MSVHPNMYFGEKIAWVLVLTTVAAFKVVAITSYNARSKAIQYLNKTISQLNNGIVEPVPHSKPPEETKSSNELGYHRRPVLIEGGRNITSGSYNFCVGPKSCPNVTTGSYNFCVGPKSCPNVTTQNCVVDIRPH